MSKDNTRTTLLERAVSTVIISFSFLAPLIFIPFVGLPLSGAKTLFVVLGSLLIFLTLLAARLSSGEMNLPKSITLASGGFIALVTLVAALFSQAPATAWSGSVYELGTAASLLGMYTLMLSGALHVRSLKTAGAICAGIIAAFFLLVLLQLLRILPGDFFSLGGVNTQTSTLLGGWSDTALFAGFVALISLALAEFAALAKWLRLFLRSIIIAALGVLVAVNFPFAWTVFGSFALVVFIYKLSLSRFSSAQKDGMPLFALATVLIAFFFMFAGGTLGEVITDYANISRIEVRPSWQTTLSIVQKTWQEDVLLGSGPQHFSEQWLRFKPEGVNTSAFWNTDFAFGVGLLPTFAITTGALGALAWLLFLGALGYRGIRTLFIAEKKNRALLLSLFLGAVYLWLVTLFYVPNIVLVALAFLVTGVFIGVAAGENVIKSVSLSAGRDPRTGFVLVLVLVALMIVSSVGIYNVGERIVAHTRAGQATRAAQEGDFQQARASINRALALHEGAAFYRLQATIEQQRLAELLNREDVSQEEMRSQFQDILGQAISASRNAIARNRGDYRNWLSLARVYSAIIPLQVQGAYENAVSALEEAVARNPKSPLLALERARIERANGDTEKAREYIRSALQLKNNYTDAILVLAQIQIEEGNVGNAIASVEQATVVEPNNAGLFFQLGLLQYREEQYSRAAEAFKRAVTLVPSYANARYFLGLSYAETGETEQAIQQFETVQETNPGNEEVKRILENLRAGRAPFEDVEATPPEEREEAPVEE